MGTVALLMLLPAGVLMITFLIIPIGLTFVLAFTNARLISPEPAEFVGVQNFVRIFSNETFWASLRNTIIFAVVIVPVQSAIALGLAMLINVKMRGVNFFRTIYFLPVVTSIVVVSILWLFLYQPNGLINALLAGRIPRAGLAGRPQHRAVRDHHLVDLAGRRLPHGHLAVRPADHSRRTVRGGLPRRRRHLEAVPPRDLAGAPATSTFILITITIAAFALFAQVNLMTKGGPLDATTTLVFQAVRTGFQQQQTGYAAAISLVFFVLVLIVSLIQRFLTRDKEPGDDRHRLRPASDTPESLTWPTPRTRPTCTPPAKQAHRPRGPWPDAAYPARLWSSDCRCCS